MVYVSIVNFLVTCCGLTAIVAYQHDGSSSNKAGLAHLRGFDILEKHQRHNGESAPVQVPSDV